MTTHNKAGVEYVKLSELKEGDTIIADAGFTCMEPGPKEVMKHGEGLFVACKDGGHWLDGQCDDGDHCIGFTKS